MAPFSDQEDLKIKILSRIGRYEARRLRLKIVAFASAIAGSLAVIGLSVQAIAGDFAQSGFLQFASLFFSNFSLATENFTDLAASLIESFPAFSASLFLGGIFVAIWSLAKLGNTVVLMKERHVSMI